MANKTDWPQSLKDFANRTFALCTDANREAVSAELKALIFSKFQEGSINTTQWNEIELPSLQKKVSKKALKKRAMDESSDAAALAGMSWEERNRREKRARRFEHDEIQRKQEEAQTQIYTAPPSLAGRMGFASPPAAQWQPAPFGGQQGPPAYGRGSFGDVFVADPNVIDWDEHTVVGTSTKLEKPYLRLTSAPDPKSVRPLPVLEQTLELLKTKWRTEQNYAYICDQFKSMRQDLTVQRIKNPFTVKVYEIHARIALEKGDLGEYNQCQSQLRVLYAYNLPGCVMEFLAYRFLYLLHTRNRREVNSLMTELQEKHKQDAAVRHALQVRSALINGNYHKFFSLYVDAPNMNAYIMDHFIERERVRALLVLAKSHRPHCPLTYITSELSFADHTESLTFLHSMSADLFVDPTPAQAASASSSATTKAKAKGKITVPLEERKWDAKAALPALTAAAAKHKKIDIKGQI